MQYMFDNTKTRLDGPITLDVNPSTSAFSLHNGQKPLELSTWGFPATLSAATIPAISGFLAVVRPCVGHLKGNRKISLGKHVSVMARNGQQYINDTRCTGVRPFLKTGECCPRCYRTYHDVCRLPMSNGRPQDKKTQDDKTQGHKTATEVVSSVLAEYAPNLSSETKVIVNNIIQNSNAQPTGHRWDQTTVRLAMNVWTASPKAYQDLSEKFPLPSVRLLQYYKNIIHQRPGFIPEVFQWAHQTAEAKKIPLSGRRGGIVFDEMSLQEDLQLDTTGGSPKLVGCVELTPECSAMETVRHKRKISRLATHVLQLEFLGYSGFNFPLAHFPTSSVQAYHLIPLFWQCVRFLHDYDFHIDFVLMDGAVCNRSFLKALCHPSEPLSVRMTISNLEEKGHSIILGMDVKHVVKRLRNNVYSSGEGQGYTRLLQWKGASIIWDHWREAFEWDRSTNPEMMRLHHKLSQEHIDLTSSSKMRNHLAEQCLDRDMLNLMTCYANSQHDGTYLQGSLALLEQTSKLVAIMNDNRHVVSLTDGRLQALREVSEWFSTWQKEEKEKKISSKNLSTLMSNETMEDIQFCCTSLLEIIKRRVAAGEILLPSRMNSDVVENFFCQQRAKHHGACNNPTYLQYSKGVNTILLSSRSKGSAKKSNAGINGAAPYNFDYKQPLTKKKKK